VFNLLKRLNEAPEQFLKTAKKTVVHRHPINRTAGVDDGSYSASSGKTKGRSSERPLLYNSVKLPGLFRSRIINVAQSRKENNETRILCDAA
jgi:hypothetical protein